MAKAGYMTEPRYIFATDVVDDEVQIEATTSVAKM